MNTERDGRVRCPQHATQRRVAAGQKQAMQVGATAYGGGFTEANGELEHIASGAM